MQGIGRESKALGTEAVSYTHLDVYKRQSLGLSMTRVLFGLSLFYFLIPGYILALGLSLVAVSYTHLDVYKRQTNMLQQKP